MLYAAIICAGDRKYLNYVVFVVVVVCICAAVAVNKQRSHTSYTTHSPLSAQLSLGYNNILVFS